MSRLRIRPFALVCMAVFVLGLATYSVSSFQQSKKDQVEPARAFKLVLIESDTDANGVESFKAIRVKEVDAQGYWRSAVHSIGKSSETEYEHTSEGLFLTKDEERTLMSKRPSPLEMWQKTRMVTFYENHPDLIGTDVIAGLKVYRLRVPLEQENGWLEMANSPKIGHSPLRIILHKPDGSEHRIEAVRVEFQ
jgi:hypothetical protein